jgi:hypothetical protein
MKGHQNLNFPAFYAAEEALLRAGWNVINPARMDTSDGSVEEGVELLPIDHYIRRDFDALMSLDPGSDALVQLPEWETSVGARAEAGIVAWRGVAIVPLREAISRD